MTTEQYLADLVNQKNQLVANLTTKGVTASEDETLNTLVPKVLDIQTGGENIVYPKYIRFDGITRTSGVGSTLDLSWLRTNNITNMNYMFGGSNNLSTLDLSKFNTSNVTNMESMFNGCYGLSSLDLSNFDTSKVTTMASMFSACQMISLLDISSFDTSNVTAMNNMFHDMDALSTIDLSHFDTSKVTTMASMFSNSSSLVSLDLSNFDMSNVTSTNQMFNNDNRLTTLFLNMEGWEKPKLKDIYGMFNGCRGLTSISAISCDAVNNITNVVNNCTALTDLGGFINLGKGFNASYAANYYKLQLNTCTNLTHDSLMNVINGLYDIATAGMNAHQLNLGATNLAKLTEEEIAIATNKGWNVI